jgi:hypothetical protein
MAISGMTQFGKMKIGTVLLMLGFASSTAYPNDEVEHHDDKYKNLMRVGIAYEYSFHQRWSASPEIPVGFVEGGAKPYVVEIAIGCDF